MELSPSSSFASLWQSPLFLLLLASVIVLVPLFYLLTSPEKKPPPSCGDDGDGRQTLPLPPSPPGAVPFLGHLPLLGPLPHRKLRSLAASHGAVMLLRLGGAAPTVVASSPAAAREAMRTRDAAFASRAPVRMAQRLIYGRDMVFAPYGEYWRQARRVAVLHLLSPNRVASFRLLREREVAALLAGVRLAAGAVVNLSNALMSYANGVISRAAFGDGGHGLDGETLRRLFADFEQLLGTMTLGEFVPWLVWVDKLMGLDAKAARTAAVMDGLLERVIAEHRERRRRGETVGDGDHRDFVDVMLDVSEEEERAGGEDVQFDTVAIKAIVLDMIAAATDTTFTTLEWAMAELINHPSTMRKLQHDIRAAVGGAGTQVTEDHLGELHFLRAVVKETLRLHAPVPLLVPRETTEDTQLLGYRVPARTRVVINAWAIGRDAAAWGDDAEEFLPERWLDGDGGGGEAVEYAAQIGQDFRFVPFGAGRRGCPGAGFAAPSVELALAGLLYHFDWELPPAPAGGTARVDMSELYGLSVRLKAELNLVAKPWSSNMELSSLAPLLHSPLLLAALVLVFSWRLIVPSTKRRPPPPCGDGSRQLPLPPSPPGELPFLGHLTILGSLPHRKLRSLAAAHGPVMLLRFGRVPTVVASSAAAAQEVMRTRDTAFASRPRVRAAERLIYGRDMVFAPSGEFWRQARRVAVLHLLSPNRVASFRLVREREVAALLDAVRRRAGIGVSSVNLSELLMSFANGVISRAAFGGDGGYRLEKAKELFADFEEILGTVTVGEFVPWLAWVDKLKGLDAKAAGTAAAMDGLLERVIADHRERRRRGETVGDGELDHRDSVDVMLDVSEEEERAGGEDVQFDSVAIKAVILDMFAAGTSTTFTTTEWVMAELINHPPVMHKLQGEIRAAVAATAIAGTPVTEDHLGKLHFLRTAIKETLRLHAPAPLLLPRETTEDTELLGYRVPARTRVLVNAWAIGRDTATWGDTAEEFVPERWLDGGGAESTAEYAQQLGNDFRFVPFGAGRRGCPGVGFAAPSVELALANLLYHFDWELSPPATRLDMGELFGLAVRLKADLNLAMRTRGLAFASRASVRMVERLIYAHRVIVLHLLNPCRIVSFRRETRGRRTLLDLVRRGVTGNDAMISMSNLLMSRMPMASSRVPIQQCRRQRGVINSCSATTPRRPARMQVVNIAWAIGRDAAAWGESSEEFSPSNVSTAAGEVVEYTVQIWQDFRFVPFGAGFATPSVELVLAGLLCHFHWELALAMVKRRRRGLTWLGLRCRCMYDDSA
uniref:Cytochrome P450 n=1 Tax=Leersia perrieri TaxID=77586 RepID=A0A0D9UYJ4_9ORYZ